LKLRDDLPLKSILSIPSGRSETDEMPLVIIMHGRGADANDLADIAPTIDGPGGYRFLFPNAPRPWEAAPGLTFGYTWFDGLPPDPKSIAASRALVMQFLDAALKEFPTPRGKVVIGGFSQGALMALDAGLRTAQPIAGIVTMSGALFEPELPDVSSKKDVPILIVHGTGDEMINVNRARRARRVLEGLRLEVEYHEFPMGHHLTPESMMVVRQFVQNCLR
jgi:phospholipase/carboxylesterase